MAQAIKHLIRHMFGDCSRRECGHSITYHVPIGGCLKCDCDEYK